MNGIIELQIKEFLLVYLLLIVVAVIMKRCKIDKTKILIVASMRMTVQLMLAGFILTYIFKNPHPVLTLTYLVCMTVFAIHRALAGNNEINRKFKLVISLSVSGSGALIVLFFVCGIVGVSFFEPQYVIPIAGMVMGNTMTGVALGVKTFRENIKEQRLRINALINAGAAPENILLPFMKQALETALLPTINSMLGMGIVSLPGMMTGQILSGTLPSTAILYQIAMMISICTAVCLATFASLHFGMKTMYNSKNQIIIP